MKREVRVAGFGGDHGGRFHLKNDFPAAPKRREILVFGRRYADLKRCSAAFPDAHVRAAERGRRQGIVLG